MGRKYIIEIIGGEEGDMDFSTIEPYTEPDLEQVRKEAYDKGYDDAKSGYDNGFENGMIVAWDAVRNIILEENNGGFSTSTFYKIFGFEVSSIDVLKTLNASECIEKIRQYEREKEIDGLRQNIHTIVDQCGYSLDEIAEVLQKMKES